MEDVIYRQLYELEDRHWWFRGRRAVIWSLLRRAGIVRSPRILDAGCGTGRNLQEYGRLGPSEGIEPSEQAVEFCHERGLTQVRRGVLESLPYEGGSFDLLMACDVIEHIEDDSAALAELRRVASPASRLVVTVPAYQWLWSHHDETHHHHRRYTRRVLVERAGASGWRPLLATYFNTLLLAPIAAVRAIQRVWPPRDRTNYEATPQRLNRVLELPLRAEARAIERGIDLPAGVSVGLVCEPA